MENSTTFFRIKSIILLQDIEFRSSLHCLAPSFLNQGKHRLNTHFTGSFDKRDCKLSSRVPNIVIFLLIADA